MRVHVDVSIVNDFISYEFNGCTTYIFMCNFLFSFLYCLLTLSAICYDRMNEKHYLKFVCVIGWLVMMVICIHHHHCRHQNHQHHQLCR